MLNVGWADHAYRCLLRCMYCMYGPQGAWLVGGVGRRWNEVFAFHGRSSCRRRSPAARSSPPTGRCTAVPPYRTRVSEYPGRKGSDEGHMGESGLRSFVDPDKILPSPSNECIYVEFWRCSRCCPAREVTRPKAERSSWQAATTSTDWRRSEPVDLALGRD